MKYFLMTFIAMFVALLIIVDTGAAQEPLNIQVVTGGHNYQVELYKVFMDKPEWTWAHEYPAEHAYRGDLRKKFDVIVMYDMTVPDIGDKAKKNLREFIEADKGVVVIHHAILNQGYGEWWWRDIVGGLYLREPNPMGNPVNSTFEHDIEIAVRPRGKHVITDGLGEFSIIDEAYKGQWFSDRINVIMETDHEKADGPLVWIGPTDQSRIVHMQLGHDKQAYLNPKFQELVRRAILWAGGKLK
jgi:type 1 glutamine amidotransferase